MQSANLPYKKVQNKHGKQLNFMHHFVLEHTRHKRTCAEVNFSQTTNVELIACVQFKVFEKFKSAYHMRNHVINYS